MVKCTADAYCDALEQRIEGRANERRKGFILMVLMNMMTGDTRKVGVAYKTSAKDGGLMLNNCPFCGEKIDAGFREVAPEAPADHPPVDVAPDREE